MKQHEGFRLVLRFGARHNYKLDFRLGLETPLSSV